MAITSHALSEQRQDPRTKDFVVASPLMLDLIKLATLASRSDAKVLITGESGVGKDLIAQHIHAQSSRIRGQFVAVNCAGLTETLLESELFGHVRGSFTGAYRDKPGKLQLADRGTLFLDEVGEMSLRMQALLLRFLENGEIQAVGSDKLQTTVDVRVVAATNRNLAELVAQGHFREDLLYRLRVIHFHVPPLRERQEDIRPLADHFLRRSKTPVTLSPEAWQALERYRWPGNVRELQNVIEQVMWLATGEQPIDVHQLPQAIQVGQAILPSRERRRQISDDLYQAILGGGYSFWEHIHPLFLSRDITRHDLRELVRRGLSISRGNYRSLLQLFRIPKSDYKRFMNFLATHDCRIDYREFRNPHAELARVPRLGLPAVPRVVEPAEGVVPAK
jgi:transcriptional regulator with PAS, ATPase and Fis domain